MYLYLREPKSDKETMIILQYRIGNQTFKYPTGEKILPEYWSTETKQPISKKGSFGNKLKRIATIINRYNDFLQVLIENAKINNTEITKDYLKSEFNKNFKINKRDNNLKKFTYFTDFVDDFCINAPNQTNRITKRKYTLTKIKHYIKTNNRLKEFEKTTKKRIKLNDFSINVYDKFIDYLIEEKKYAINYAGDLIKIIKVFHSKAEELGYIVCQDYKSSNFTVLKEKSIAIALNEDEIQAILDYDFSDNDRLQNCRDLAIIGLWTGLRVSDFLNLPKININDKFITVQPQKTKHSSGIKVVIPLHHHIKEVISKRGMPRMISDIKFNKYIKEICKIVGIDNTIKGSLMVYDEDVKEYRKKVGYFPKYKLVSSHTCRRSFATNLYKMNFPTLSIMNITGHTTEKSFLTYIKVTPTEHAEKLLKHWEEYYANKNN